MYTYLIHTTEDTYLNALNPDIIREFKDAEQQQQQLDDDEEDEHEEQHSNHDRQLNQEQEQQQEHQQCDSNGNHELS